MNLTREKTNLLAVLAMALCVMVVSACWMMMRFGSLMSFFDFSDSGYMNWVLNAYIICDIAMIPVGGKLSDHFGEKKVMAVGAALFVIATLICTFSTSFAMMSWFRGVSGAGAGLIIGAAFAVPGTIGKYFRGLSFGQELMAGAFAIGSLFGAAVGYFVLNNADDWRYMYYVPAAIVTLGSVMAWLTLPERTTDSRTLDVQGLALLSCIFFTIAGMVQVIDIHFFTDNHWTLLMLPLLGMMILAFYYREKLAAHTVLPRGMKKAIILQIIVLILVSVFVIGLLQLYMKIYLIRYDFDIYKASILFLCLLVGALCTSMPGGHKVGHTGARPFLILGCILMTVSLALTYFLITSGVMYLHLIMVIMGAGLGCMVTIIICSVQYNTAVEDRGAVTSFAVASRMLGIIGGLAGVTNYTVLNIDSYLEPLIGQQMSGSMNIVEIIEAILIILVDTGVDVSEKVLDLYVDSFRDWSIGSMVVLVIIGILCYLGYKENDAVPPEVENAECAGYPAPAPSVEEESDGE